jgi:hypothetical protein
MDIIPGKLDSGCSFSSAVVVMGISFVGWETRFESGYITGSRADKKGSLTGYGFLHGGNRLNAAISRLCAGVPGEPDRLLVKQWTAGDEQQGSSIAN